MKDAFACPECGSGRISPSRDTLVCESCGHRFWTAEEAPARELQQLSKRAAELSLAGRTADAEASFRKAVELCRGYADGSPDAFLPHLSAALINLGDLLFAEGRDGEAEPLYREAVGIRRDLAARAPDVFSPGLARGIASLADLLKRDGKLDKAERLYREALDLWAEPAAGRPFGHLAEVAGMIVAIAELLIDTGRVHEAEEFMRMAQDLSYALREIKEEL